jgi:hypothetical protein
LEPQQGAPHNSILEQPEAHAREYSICFLSVTAASFMKIQYPHIIYIRRGRYRSLSAWLRVTGTANV